MTFYLILVLHCAICVVLIGVVLAQHGKGADAGVVMGGAGSGTNNAVLGGGGADFATKLTTGLAIAFMVSSILLVRSYQQGGIVSGAEPVSVLEGTVMDAAPQPVDISTIEPGAQFQIVDDGDESEVVIMEEDLMDEADEGVEPGVDAGEEPREG